jgi:hypothetical protein
MNIHLIGLLFIPGDPATHRPESQFHAGLLALPCGCPSATELEILPSFLPDFAHPEKIQANRHVGSGSVRSAFGFLFD